MLTCLQELKKEIKGLTKEQRRERLEALKAHYRAEANKVCADRCAAAWVTCFRVLPLCTWLIRSARLYAAQELFKVVCGFIVVVETLAHGSQVKAAVLAELAKMFHW